jgi:hypothetical protein
VFSIHTAFYSLHSHLLKQLQEMQRQEHPVIPSISKPIFDTLLHAHDIYAVQYEAKIPRATALMDGAEFKRVLEVGLIEKY